MKRILITVLLVLVLFQSACSPKAAPTLASVGKPGQSATEAPQAAAPTQTPKASTVEKFDSGDNWLAAKTITTQGAGGVTKSVVDVKEGALNFNIPDKETFIYTFYKKEQKEDVALEVSYENTGLPVNGFALVCRAAADYSKWYEARVASTGAYAIYRYDAARKDVSQNPYVKLKAGTMEKYTILPTKANTIKFTCKGSQLTLEVNGGKFVVSENNPDLTGGGLVGIGAVSVDQTPVRFKVESFQISNP
jgi:hypothetical protein